LHPFGQSRIGKVLAQVAGAGVNVVIETHSEHVINGIRLASLTGKIKPGDVIVNFVTRPEDETSPVREIDLTDFGDLTAYPKGFFDQEQADIAAIIREKRKKL
jgi:predicted ATPase